MKKILLFIGALLLLVVGFFLVAGLFISKEYHFERTISINAPQAVVWENVSKFANHEKWSPWKDHDPNMKVKIEGQDGTVGAVYSWVGNKEVGSGSQTLKALTPQSRVETLLQFKEPQESEAHAFIALKPQGPNTTDVTWGFDSEFPYPFNAIVKVCMDMDAMMDQDFSKGLQKLKTLSEGK